MGEKFNPELHNALFDVSRTLLRRNCFVDTSACDVQFD